MTVLFQSEFHDMEVIQVEAIGRKNLLPTRARASGPIVGARPILRLIGSFPFLAGSSGSIAITNTSFPGNFIVADGLKLVRTGPYVPPKVFGNGGFEQVS